MKSTNSFPVLVFFTILGVGVAVAYSLVGASETITRLLICIIAFVAALTVSNSIKVADQWQRTVVLRLGSLYAMKGPGLFFIIQLTRMAQW